MYYTSSKFTIVYFLTQCQPFLNVMCLFFYSILLNNSRVLITGITMTNKFCESVYNVAFVMSNRISKNMLFLNVGSFIFGLTTGITICNILN